MNKKKALVTGISGQDGSYLAEFLLKKGYEVHGIIRRSSSFNTGRINHIFSKLKLHYGDMTDSISVLSLVDEIKPDEIFNLAAQSHVFVSFEIPEFTTNSDAVGVLRILEAVKKSNLINHTKIYQASTSEMFGNSSGGNMQNELTPMIPRSPYGVAKLYAHHICRNYRESYNMFASCGILFNHCSIRRGNTFVEKKITNFVKQIRDGKDTDPLKLGNIYAKRDFGYAPEYVEAMWLMLQQDKPDDFVIATGKPYSVKDICDYAFKHIGITLFWETSETGFFSAKDVETNKVLIVHDEKYIRPAEVDFLMGDSSKAQKILGWKPKKSFHEILDIMIDNDDDFGEIS